MNRLLPFVNRSSLSRSLFPLLRKSILVAPVLLLAPGLAPVQAADFSVSGSSACTLADAINAANSDAVAGSCAAGSGADTITLTTDITLGASLPQITTEIIVNGGGKTINGDGKYRPFSVSSAGNLTLNNLIIDKAYTAGQFDHGASITSAGTLNLNRTVVRNGKTDTTVTNAISAGGIYIGGGTAKIKDSVIYNNKSLNDGGGIRIDGGTVTIVNTSIFGNRNDGRGGGINMQGGTLHLYHSTVTDNTPDSQNSGSIASETGGGLHFYSGTLTMVNSIIFGNARDDCAIRSAVTISQIAGNVVGSGSTSNCTSGQTTDDPQLAGPFGDNLRYYIPRVGSPAIDAISSCITSAVNGLSLAFDQRGEPRPRLTGTNCDVGAIEHAGYAPRPAGPAGPGGSGGSSGTGGTGKIMSPAETCADLMKMAPAVEVSNAGGGTACQEVEPAGYGHPDLAAEKPASVVDVWGDVTAGTQVCFQGTSGKIRYVDTSKMKRTVTTLSTFSKGNMICATISGPGQVALIQDGSAPGGQAPAAQEAEAPEPAQQQAAQQAPASNGLNGCMVKTQGTLNFRKSPAGDRLEFTDPWGNANSGWLPGGVTLTALERSGNWLKVDYYGTQGWVSAAYVTTSGSCG